MKWFVFMVGSMLIAILTMGCDLDPVVWDGSHYLPLEKPTEALTDAGPEDGGELDTGTDEE